MKHRSQKSSAPLYVSFLIDRGDRQQEAVQGLHRLIGRVFDENDFMLECASDEEAVFSFSYPLGGDKKESQRKMYSQLETLFSTAEEYLPSFTQMEGA